uniref:Retrotrans_gag domain-containing protein n=1 Tax=Globodera pallida TaxID=36090 RepID=A0A183CP32_GLOPA
MLLQVKQANTTVRVEDLEKVFGEVIRLEEAINRALRNTNRKTYQCQTNISQLAGEINTGFQTMTAQITSLADKQPPSNIQRPNQHPNRTTPPAAQQQAAQPQAAQPQAAHPQVVQPPATLPADEDSDGDNGALERTFQSVNMITDSPTPLEVYRDDCIITYDRWAKRFREYMDAFGKKFDEKDKLARQALMACRQIEGEPVKDFLNRFIPLAEASVADVKDQTQKESQLRELFLDRLRPNISLVMKMLDMSRGKKTVGFHLFTLPKQFKPCKERLNNSLQQLLQAISKPLPQQERQNGTAFQGRDFRDQRDRRPPMSGANAIQQDRTVALLDEIAQGMRTLYTSVGRFKGRFVANTWLSEDAQYGLHFKNKAPRARSCDKLLELSEQGFATRVVSSKRIRSRRDHESGEGLGLVTSPELSAQLTYLDNEWVESLTYALRHAFKAQCDFITKQRE